MPLSYRQAGNLFLAGPNISIYPSGNGFAISGISTGTTTGITNITTIGVGQFSIASSITNNNLVYRSLSATSGFGIIESPNGTLTFTAANPSGISGVYVSGISSAGTGNILLLSSITNNNLVYDSIVATGGLGIIESPNGTLTFTAASSVGGTIISGTNIGTGVGVFSGLTTINNPNDTLGFYNLLEGDNVGIATNDNNEIVINRGRTVVNTLTNQGGGSIIYSSITTNNITVRTFLASSSGFTVALVNNPSVTGATSAITANTLVRIIPTNATADRFYINSSTGTLDVPAAATLSPLAASATMGINATPLATTRLLIGAGSATISQIRLTPFSTETTNPSDGDVWFTTSGNTLKFEKGTVATDFIFKDNNISLSGYSNILVVDTGGTITPRYVNSFGVFNTLSSVTVANTSTETSIISSVFTGSTTILASTNPNNPELVVGKKFRFNAKGTIQTDNTNTLEVKIKLGSTTIGTTTAFNVKKNINALTYFEIDATFTIRNSGIVSCNGKIFASEIIQDSPNINIKGITNQNATVATTSDQVFDCTIKFDQAQPNNIITINESTLEFLN